MSMHCHRKAPNDTIYKIYFKATPPFFQLLDGMTNCDSLASSSSTFPIVATASHRNPSPTLKTAESATSQVYVSQPCSITHDSEDTWMFLFRNQQLSLFRIKTHKTTDSRRSWNHWQLDAEAQWARAEQHMEFPAWRCAGIPQGG